MKPRHFPGGNFYLPGAPASRSYHSHITFRGCCLRDGRRHDVCINVALARRRIMERWEFKAVPCTESAILRFRWSWQCHQADGNRIANQTLIRVSARVHGRCLSEWIWHSPSPRFIDRQADSTTRWKCGRVSDLTAPSAGSAYRSGEKGVGTTSMFCMRTVTALGSRLRRLSTTEGGQMPAFDAAARIRSRSP
jgi:hypothetical protein